MRDAERKISMRLEKYFEDPEILHVGTEETGMLLRATG